MATTPQQLTRWCHACQRAESFDAGWFEVWINQDGGFVVVPADPAQPQLRGDVFACGQGSAMVLFERYLHNRTFEPQVHNPPQQETAAQPPSPNNDCFTELT